LHHQQTYIVVPVIDTAVSAAGGERHKNPGNSAFAMKNFYGHEREVIYVTL